MSDYIKIKESQTLLVNAQSLARAQRGLKTYKFGFGQSPFLPPQHVIKAFKKNTHRKEYSTVQGSEELREQVSRFHHRWDGIESRAEDIFIAPGSKILIYTILASFKKADVLIPSPSWVSYAPQAKLAGHHVISIDTSFDQRWRITPRAIKAALARKRHRPTLAIFNHPGNPDGLSYTRKELKKLAALFEENDILVISDEIYARLSFGLPHWSMARFYPQKTITTSGLSKWCGAGGWRLGIAILYPGIDKRLKKAMLGIASETYSCAPSPVQLAATVAYSDDETMRRFIKKQRKVLKTLAHFCYESLVLHDVRIHPPQGAFYLFPDFSNFKKGFKRFGISNNVEMCERLLADTGVALLPGKAFGQTRSWTARLSYVDFEDPLRHSKFDIFKHAPKVVEGIDALCQWLKQFR